ncbi:hypothetical protein ACHAWF_008834 [Thalassiosira exigua]
MDDHIYIFTMGGTIDKDYPRLTSGYAFEFGEESAATRILSAHPNLGISFDVTSICKMDSLEIADHERGLLFDAICRVLAKESSQPKRVVVTHGTDTMIETARYIQNRMDGKIAAVIAFTGATKPERFVDSDASFNVGLAVGATSCCSPGFWICMNGNAVPIDRCIRDEQSGLFKWK